MTVSPPPQRRASDRDPDYRRLLELVHAIVWRADARTFQTTYATGVVADILGYPLDAWTSEPRFWIRHLHPDDVERVLAFSREAVRDGRTHDFEYRMIGADGRVVWLRNIVTVVMKDGVPVELVGVTTSVDERKRAEFEAAQLRAEMNKLTRVAALGELSTLLAHELNQPLGAIVANAETALLQLQQRRATLDELRPILEDIRRDAERGGSVIHALLALLQRGSGQRQRFAVASIVGDVLSALRPLTAARGIVVDVDIPAGLPQAEGDMVQLRQVVLNLAANAIDAMHAPRSTPGRLRVSARAVDDSIEVAVADTGPGISREMLPRLFEPFATTKPEGVGIGLAMCKRIVEAHGGRITGENNPTEGATFRFTVQQGVDRKGVAA